MLANIKLTVQESLRYRGRSGHYSWLMHRLTGLAILGFLVIHVWDGANLYFAPNLWAWSVNIFKHPLFGVGEIAVFGAVIYHALNGLRITLLDFKPEWWHYQAKSATVVWVIFLVTFAIVGTMLMIGIVESCQYAPVWEWAGQTVTGNSCWTFAPLDLFTP